MSALREILAKFRVDFDDKELKEGDKSTKKATASLRDLAKVVTAGALVQGVRSFVNEIRGAGDELDKSSKQIGLATNDLQELRHAANLSGVDAQAFTQSLRLLQKNQDMAAQGSKMQAELFERLGVATTGADGRLRTLNDILPDLAQGFADNENSAERVALAQQLLGRTGARLLPMFENGAQGLAKMRAEAAALGGGLSQEAVDGAVELTDNLARLDFALLGIKSRLAVAILPIIDWTVQKFTTFTAWLKKVTDGTNLVEASIIVLSVALTTAMAPAMSRIALAGWAMLKPLLPWIAAIGLAILVVDELITTWKGGDTLLRRAIDGIFGDGTTAQIVAWIKQVISDFAYFFNDIQNVMTALHDSVGGKWNALGESITSTTMGLITWLLTSWYSLQEGAGQVWQAIADAITTPITAAVATIRGAIQGMIGFVSGAVDEATSLLAKLPGGDKVLEFAGVAASPPQASAPGAVTNNRSTRQQISQSNRISISIPNNGGSANVARDVGRAVVTAINPSLNGALSSLAPGFE